MDILHQCEELSSLRYEFLSLKLVSLMRPDSQNVFYVLKVESSNLIILPLVLASINFKHLLWIRLMFCRSFSPKLPMNPLIWMNPKFGLSCELFDIDLILINSYVILCGLFIDVIIIVEN